MLLKNSPLMAKTIKKVSKKSATKEAPLAPEVEATAAKMKEILALLGENPKREGLIRTPQRYAKAMRFLTSGYESNIDEIIGNALFKEDQSEIVILKDIELFSLCEHHLLPFFGKAHVAYIPNGKIIGLSKIPRIVDVFSRRLQVQERLTTQISETLMKKLGARGVAVIIEASHLCMMMRGVEKQNSYTITSSMLGDFRTEPTTRKELLHLLGSLGRSK